jgi:hypothetical protein
MAAPILSADVRAALPATEKYWDEVKRLPDGYVLAWDLLFLENDPTEQELLDTAVDDSSIALTMNYNSAAPKSAAKAAAKKGLLRKAIKNYASYTPVQLFFHQNGNDKVKTWLACKSRSPDPKVAVIADMLLEIFDVIHFHFSSQYTTTASKKKSVTDKIAAQAEHTKWALYHYMMRCKRLAKKKKDLKDVYIEAYSECVAPLLEPAICQQLAKQFAKTGPKLAIASSSPAIANANAGRNKNSGTAVTVKEFQDMMLQIAKDATRGQGRDGRPYDHVKDWTPLAQKAKAAGAESVANWAEAKKITCPNCLYRSGTIEAHALGDCKKLGHSMWLVCSSCHSTDDAHWFDACKGTGKRRKR